MGKDYFYFINKLTMPKPADYPKFTVMIYSQVITSDDNPIVHQSTTPTFETVSASAAFYGESSIDSSLWMVNQYAYTEQTGSEILYYATGNWND